MKRITKKALGLTTSVAAGVVLAANPNWFAVNTSYGTGGVSAPLSSMSYGRAQAVDHNDAAHTVYSLVTTLPKNTIGYVGPYSIARRTSAGAVDTTFGKGGVTTSFAKSGDRTYNFHALCIDPFTHNLIVVGDIHGTTTVVERLLPPDANGVAASDATFNPLSNPAGVVTLNGPLGAQGCTVTGDQSVIVAGSDYSSPNRAVIARLLVDGTLDPTFGTNGILKVAAANGENWEGGGIEWNSAQTITRDIVVGGDTYPAGNLNSKTAALIAFDWCTGAADTQFNGSGFMSVPPIDGNSYSSPISGAVLSDGSILLALVVNGSLNADLVGWSYPVTASQHQSPTAPGTITPPGSLTVGAGLSDPSPARQSDGSILLSAETASNEQSLFELQGDSALGFTVGQPASFGCPAPATVPNVVGQTQAAAMSAITGTGLAVGTVAQQPSSTVPSGSVISESPAAGTRVAPGSAVNLVVSSGPGPSLVTVPDVVGQTQAAATNAITGVGLTVGTVTQQSSNAVASGSVISESPAAGTSVASGSAVSLVVSTGPAPVTVPNVVGQAQAAATSAITGAGLTVGTITQQSSSTVPSGSVISESPAAGTSVASGSAVNLVVSSGPSQVAVPNVVGETQAAATSAITGAGLTVGTVTQQSSSVVASGSVISESPAAGTQVAGGSAVDLVISSGNAAGGSSGGASPGGGGFVDPLTIGVLLAFLALRRLTPRMRAARAGRRVL